jgi:uncharacterized protein YndB with AHSA1/START domain
MPAEVITASVHIDAPPEQVYEYFTRPEAIISWMGRPIAPGASAAAGRLCRQPRPGGLDGSR